MVCRVLRTPRHLDFVRPVLYVSGVVFLFIVCSLSFQSVLCNHEEPLRLKK